MKLNYPTKFILIIIWCASGLIAGLLLFARGLLLHRDVLPNKSSCLTASKFCYDLKSLNAVEKCIASYASHSVNEQICIDSNFKIILIIIDALRYDFVEFNELNSNESFYSNKLVIINDLLKNRPFNSNLFKFIADPPTTTMQRILGLTTGSLPTFVDVGSNFASSEINEDNIIDILNRQGKNVVFLGDDTWSKLYPDRFIRSYPFDSFNVWDLDTVDAGIRENLFTELKKNDWHLLIAHFLGIDHCGHRYGQDHPEMKRKLEEMNGVLKEIVQEIKDRDDTLLFVIGDHGMTSTGDHGGDTENEVTTALFIHSPLHSLYNISSKNQIIRQVDLAPTLSSILGLPIPFSSVGSVVLNCIPVNIVGTVSEAVFHLWRNVEQITNYVLEYSSLNAQLKATKKVELTYQRYQTLKGVRMGVRAEVNFFLHQYKTFMSDVLAMCREVWVQFDIISIGCGLILVLITFLSLYCVCENMLTLGEIQYFVGTDAFVLVAKVICLLPVVVFSLVWTLDTNIEFVALTTFGVVCNAILLWRCRRLCKRLKLKQAIRQKLTPFNAFLAVVTLVTMCGLFSNSFIIEEPSVILFLLLSVVWVCFLFRRPSTNVWTSSPTLLSSLATVQIAFRVALQFVKCHEEQERCQDAAVKKYETRLCVVSIVAVGLYVGYWLKNSSSKVLSFMAVLCTLLLAVYWIYEAFFEQISFVRDIPAALLPSTVSSVCYSIVCPYVRRSDQRSLWRRLNASFANTAVFLSLLGCVLLGQAYAVPVILMMVGIRAVTAFSSSCCELSRNVKDRYLIPWSYVMLWAMSSIYWFYVTGHYASFSGIQWNSAFLLQKEIGNNMLVPGTLVMLNTFFSFMVHAIMLPTLLISRVESTFKPDHQVHLIQEAATVRLMSSFDELEYVFYGVFMLIMKYLTFFGVRLFFVMLSTTILSRHLMMWKIFAPKFIFEAIAFIAITVPSVLVGFVCVYRIGKRFRQEAQMQEKRIT